MSNLWIATPGNENDIIVLANWASRNNFKLRASGYMHNWSPLTVTKENNPNVVLVDTTINLKKIRKPTQLSSTKYAVTVQTGASMLEFLTFLENYELGLYAVPAPGDITVGGVLAIGGHGTGVPFVGEKIPDGHALGTISNLVISFKAVVWNAKSNTFVLKTFQRSDVEAKAFLVNLGRTFITEVTLLVGLNFRVQCVSRTDIKKSELFSKDPGPKTRTFSSLLDETGRVETIAFPFTDRPWLKVWTIKPTKPLLSREVKGPFNYIFSDRFPEQLTDLLGEIGKGASHLTPAFGIAQLAATDLGLTATLTRNIWGWSKNLLLYIRPTTFRVTANGYAVITERSNVQKVVSSFNEYFDKLIDEYRKQGKYPFNGPMEIRATSIDKPGIVTNGESPALSPIHPVNDHPEYDTVIWLDILSIPDSLDLSEAMHKIEKFVLKEYNGTYASVRPEWSKGWAYTDESAWANENFYRNFVPSTFPSATASHDGWDWAVQTLNKYDPKRIFTNSFIDSLLQTVSND